ncbi:Kinesin-related protein 1 [Pteropus alecto]|uniref:Kinesin-related protein 1 n=1 Tax=Pteropus alecto TaxID=9402 RepID=L5KGD3_PTEAL|nr:Kinesin-related protein 1 [Pteropus alecto]
MHSGTTTIQDPKNPEHVKTFTFDLAYWSHSGFQMDKDGVFISADPNSKFASQSDVFHDLGRAVLDSAWQGYNATLLAYGQTGSGKSYSMMGSGANKGLVPRVCEELFQATETQERNQEHQTPLKGTLSVIEADVFGVNTNKVTFSMLEIYNEQVRDLLSRTKKPGGLKVREDQQLGFYVEGLTSVPCENYVQIERLMEQGTKIRTTASTSMNASSSRSHMVITIQFKQSAPPLLPRAPTAPPSTEPRLPAASPSTPATCCLNPSLPAEQSAHSRAEHGLRTDQLTWAHQLEQAREEWRQHYVAIAQERQMMKTVPHLLNVNEDPQLTGVLKHFLQADFRPLGLLSYQLLQSEALLTIPAPQPPTPNPLGTRALGAVCRDRIILGSNSAYLYVGFPWERGGEDLSRFDYDFFQLERAAAEGVSVDQLGAGDRGEGKADPSVLVVFQDYVKLMPLVAEANQMSEELKKPTGPQGPQTNIPSQIVLQGGLSGYLGGFYVTKKPLGTRDPITRKLIRDFITPELKMELKVKNLASSDSRGCDLQKEVMVKVTNQRTHEVWIWSKAKFINRKFLMEELYQRFLDGEDSHVVQEDDPFWDPVQVVHLGSAHIWLQPLAYCMKFEEQAEFLNCDGLEEAVLHIHITPCSPAGRACGEEDVVIDPLELLGKRMDFQIRIVRCLGAKWLKEDAERGIQMGYRIYNLPYTLYTKPVWKIMNPQIEESVQFTALNASQEFLNYLQTNALIVDLWGLQEGCTELSCSQLDLLVTDEGHIMVDTKKISTVIDIGQTASAQMSELYLKLLRLEQETGMLRSINRALSEENVLLKESLEKTGSGQRAHQPSSTLKITGMTAPSPAARELDQACTQRASYDREFAKALKGFYQSMNVARGKFLKLRCHKPPEDDQMLRPFVHQQSQMLKDFGELLESSLWKLKNDVALIVKKKRECLLHSE